jgi:hypothetical protein
MNVSAGLMTFTFKRQKGFTSRNSGGFLTA